MATTNETRRPAYERTHPDTGVSAAVHVGDCREILAELEPCRKSEVDLIFADPPFNWARAYDEWDDRMSTGDYLDFTYEWLDLCVKALKPTGALWVNIPDDWAAEIVVYLKNEKRMQMINWCIWHYRFGQNTNSRFISSKVHVLYFGKDGWERTWNPEAVFEPSDRATTYNDPRTQSKKDGSPPGMRMPMDVWYGQYWGRIQGNNLERRHYHDNQLPEVYLERVIRVSSNKGDLVIDPFLGSGTTGVVAHALGRRFIGCEYSEQNATFAWDRIEHGPVRLGGLQKQSSAIFEARRRRAASRPRKNGKDAAPA